MVRPSTQPMYFDVIILCVPENVDKNYVLPTNRIDLTESNKCLLPRCDTPRFKVPRVQYLHGKPRVLQLVVN